MGNSTDWENNNFPDADDPDDVEWMLVSWKIVPKDHCEHCTRGDYGLRATQFDHLPPGTTRPQALAKLDEYKQKYRTNGFNPKRKNHVVFLCRVEAYERISDLAGGIVDG